MGAEPKYVPQINLVLCGSSVDDMSVALSVVKGRGWGLFSLFHPSLKHKLCKERFSWVWDSTVPLVSGTS